MQAYHGHAVPLHEQKNHYTMRYMNRRKNTLGILLVQAAVLLSATSCTESTEQGMETAGSSGAIRFSQPALTRSAIGSTDDLNTDGQSFSVWGSYHHTDGTGSNVQIFDNTTVTYGFGTGWSYEGGLQYWHSGNTYDFYALYPSTETLGGGVPVACTTDGTFTVRGFDATKGHDLMTAEKTGISVVAGQTEPPGPVALKFRHLLARVTFTARSEGGNATVRSISLERLAVKGDYDSSADIPWSNMTKGTVGVEKETLVTPAGGADVSGDLLLVPQSLTDGVKLTVCYDTDAETGKTASYTLPATTVSTWEAANHYRYSFTLTGGGYIVFDTPTVNAWSDATGGNVTIDVTE